MEFCATYLECKQTFTIYFAFFENWKHEKNLVKLWRQLGYKAYDQTNLT